MDSVRIGIGALSLLSFATPIFAQNDPRDLPGKAEAVFKSYCYRCHGQNGTNEGGLNYVADLQQLVKRRKVTPSDSAKSRLFKRLLDADDPMPPAEEKSRPSAQEIAAVKAWIEAGAPAGKAAVSRKVMTA